LFRSSFPVVLRKKM